MSDIDFISPYKNLPLIVRDASKIPGTVAAEVTERSMILNVPGIGLVWRVRGNYGFRDPKMVALAFFDVPSQKASLGARGLTISGMIVFCPSMDEVWFAGGWLEAERAIHRYEEEHGAKIVQLPIELRRGLPALFEQFCRGRAWNR